MLGILYSLLALACTSLAKRARFLEIATRTHARAHTSHITAGRLLHERAWGDGRNERQRERSKEKNEHDERTNERTNAARASNG